MIQDLLGKLDRAPGSPTELDNLGVDRFNYVKNRLAQESAVGLEQCSALEARSRYFAGMIWSGLAASVLALVALVVSRDVPAPALLVLSLLVSGAFWYRIRSVRLMEVKVVLSFYLAMLASRRDGE